MRHIFAVAALLGAMPVAGAHAQSNPDSVKQRNECRLAAQVVRTGNPAPHAEWAANYLPFCDRALYVQALEHALLRLRTSTDSAALLLHWGNAGFWQDRALFNTVVTVAQDRSASLQSRLWALRTLARYLDPEGRYTIQSISGPDCILGRALPGHFVLRVITPWPSDWRDRARAVGSQVAEEANATLRTAGRCVSSAPIPLGGVRIEGEQES